MDIEKLNSLQNRIGKHIKDIEDGVAAREMVQEDINSLASIDIRDEYEKKVDNYVDVFMSGAKVLKVKHSDPRSSTYTKTERYQVEDIQHWCEKLQKEHFVKVQKEFWKEYKKKLGRASIEIKRDAIQPSVIYNVLKRIK